MAPTDRPLVWLRGEVKTPPFSASARIEAGVFVASCRDRLRRYDRIVQATEDK